MKSIVEQENWRTVAGYPLYEVSDRGRVRSLPQQVRVRGNGFRLSPSRVLKPWWVSNTGTHTGHLVVSLGRGNRFKVSHLVLETFISPRPDGLIALHYDDNPANNCVANLRWGTHSENLNDLVRNGRHHGANKTHCNYGHLLDGQLKRQRYCKTCKRSRDQRRAQVA